MKFRHTRTYYLLLISGLIIFSSCSKKWILFQQKDESTNTNQKIEVAPKPVIKSHIIQPGDLLDIKISIPNSTELVNSEGGPVSEEFAGFVVEDDSTLYHYAIGKIIAGGKTVDEIQQFITDSLKTNYSSPVVNVKLKGIRVTFFGAVMSSGTQTLHGQTISVIEGLGMARGVSQYADTKTVKIIRNEGGIKKVGIIDLTDLDAFKSPYYYLQSNDIIYVPERPSKNARQNIALFTTGISLINTFSILYIRLNRI